MAQIKEEKEIKAYASRAETELLRFDSFRFIGRGEVDTEKIHSFDVIDGDCAVSIDFVDGEIIGLTVSQIKWPH